MLACPQPRCVPVRASAFPPEPPCGTSRSVTSTPTRFEETRLVEALALGDEAALGQAYDLYSRRVYSLILRLVIQPAEAEEVMQDVFLELWRRADRFDASRGSLLTWLLTIARSRAIDRLRHHRARISTEAFPEDAEPPAPFETPADLTTDEDSHARVVAALDELPDVERRVIDLAYFEGKTQQEIAAETGWPLGTVKGRARNALRRLRACLPEELGSFG